MNVRVTSELPCAAHKVWQTVKTPSLLEEVTYPLVTFKSLDGGKISQQWSVWPHDETIYLYSYLFGVIPLGKRSLRLEIDDDTQTIQSYESDRLTPRWDHLIVVESAGPNTTRYCDEIVIEAGIVTPFVWLFAQWFYRHRQRRWQSVAERLQQEAERERTAPS